LVRLLTLFLLGAILGTLGDSMHVAAGVLGYPAPTLLGEKPWVPLIMGIGFINLVEGQAFWRARWPRVTPGKGESATTPGAVLAAAAFLAAWAATALFWRHPRLLTLALVALYCAWPGALQPRVLLSALITAALGPGVEATLSFAGGFDYYTGHLFLGVPLWLPALYLHAAMAGRFVELRFPSALPWARRPDAPRP
jgi:hypothetical protein